MGEHSARYDAMAMWLAERSCAVHAYDHRGHGLSGGRKNYVRDLDEYVGDLEAFLEIVAGEHPGKPIVLIAHSMGGLIAARYLVARPQQSRSLSCAVLSASALATPAQMSPIKSLLARIFAFLWPTLRVPSGLPATGLSRDAQVVQRYEADPLVDTVVTTGLVAALTRAQSSTLPAASRVAIPVFGLHGGADPICPASGTEQFMRNVVTPGSAHKVYAELRHEIFNEPEREEVYGDLFEWVLSIERDAT